MWTTSAPLTEPIRQVIHEAFNCRVVDQYGCCEIYWIGAEFCEKGVLHYFDTFRHLEICDATYKDCDAEVYGSVLLTDLLNHAFPLIRYQNGDRAAKASNINCRLTDFSAIRSVKGRVSENVMLPDGGFISGEFLTTVFDDFPDAVIQFQIVQHKDFNVTVKLIERQTKESAKQLIEAKNI